jgi:hypothetical protein
MTLKRSAFTALFLIGAVVFGFILLLKSCLAKYDERCALPPVLYFEKPGSQVVFSIVKFEKTVSYSSSGGMSRRTVNTSYYVQCNDAVTGEKKSSKKIKRSSKIKQYPVEILGSTTQWAWIFQGEPMAFDPFTLETKADISLLEKQNPALLGKFPAERRYYDFDRISQSMIITATDGTKWRLNATSLVAVPIQEEEETDPVKKEIARMETLEAQNGVQQDSLYKQKNRDAVDRYSHKEISMTEYQRITKQYYSERDRLSRERDSLQKMKRKLEQQQSTFRQLYQTVEKLQKGGNHFSAIKYNADTVNGKWFGLAGIEEEKEMKHEYFLHRSLYNETARRRFFIAGYAASDEGKRIQLTNINKKEDFFLDGGFLISPIDALPIKLPEGFLIVHKNQVGNEGQVQLSLVDYNGTVKWNCASGFKDWAGWILAGSKLIVTGNNNKKLSSGEVSTLLIINLTNGTKVQHDYFNDK